MMIRKTFSPCPLCMETSYVRKAGLQVIHTLFLSFNLEQRPGWDLIALNNRNKSAWLSSNF
jgi:hypothetical protein